jgi:hypothetical protein
MSVNGRLKDVADSDALIVLAIPGVAVTAGWVRLDG